MRKNNALLFGLAAAAAGFFVVRHVMAARAPTVYKGNTYASEAAAKDQKSVDELFAS